MTLAPFSEDIQHLMLLLLCKCLASNLMMEYLVYFHEIIMRLFFSFSFFIRHSCIQTRCMVGIFIIAQINTAFAVKIFQCNIVSSS